MFETDRLPAAWVEKCNALDEIWVPSAFNVETFARSGVDRAKLHIVPGALSPCATQASDQKPLPLPERRGLAFLSMFDWSLRKGWDVLLRAYTTAFDASDDVVLYLKLTSSAKLSPEELTSRVQRFLAEELGRSRKELPAVVCLSGDWSEERVQRLYRSVDAYVMPSRGEGWGRPYMEAMAAGLPTIGTRFGGNLEYMDDENSYLLDFEIAPVPEAACAEAPLFRGHSWAEPSCTHLVELLQRVARDRDEATRRGERAQREVLDRYDRRKVAAWIQSRARALALRNS
jgi:glycosyltransferase involved in cell wall biosynthesis